MARRHTSRHALPGGRGALKAAYTSAQIDLTAVRSQRYADSLEMTRLTALVDGLSAEIRRLTRELAEARSELHAARSVPQTRDPLLEVLAAQTADLRAAIAEQQQALTGLTVQVAEVLSVVVTQQAATARAEAAAAPAATTPAPAPAQAVAPEPAPAVVHLPPATAYPAASGAVGDHVPAHWYAESRAAASSSAEVARAARPDFGTGAGAHDPAVVPPTPEPEQQPDAAEHDPAQAARAADEIALDDATVMRLRLIRQTFGR